MNIIILSTIIIIDIMDEKQPPKFEVSMSTENMNKILTYGKLTLKRILGILKNFGYLFKVHTRTKFFPIY